MSQALRKLTAVVSKFNCIVVFINQLREKVGIMFGNPETTTGGRALKFYSSIRMDVRRIESLKQGGEVIGKGRNRREKIKNALAHAELEAINEACGALGGWRLPDCTLYVTLEPCPMCAGAWIW